MSTITSQMPLMAFTSEIQTKEKNSLVVGANSDFMQQIFNGEDAEHFPINISQLLSVEQNQNHMGSDLEKQYELMSANQTLANIKLADMAHNQSSALQPKAVRQTNESMLEQSVVYLLHWLASGHLSHLASDLTSIAAGQMKHTEVFSVTNTINSSNGLLMEKSSGEISFEGNKFAVKQGDNNPIDVDVSEQEGQRKAADAATVSEQFSPYLKRRLIVSSQDDHTHIILRDYFLEDESRFSELRVLLTNIKQNVSGNIMLTINGHHYGDINNYR